MFASTRHRLPPRSRRIRSLALKQQSKMAQRESRPVRYHARRDKRHEVPLGTLRQLSPFPPDLRSLHVYRRVGHAIRTLSDTLACVQRGSARKRGVGAAAVHVPVDLRGERRRRKDGGKLQCLPWRYKSDFRWLSKHTASFPPRGKPQLARGTEWENIHVIRLRTNRLTTRLVPERRCPHYCRRRDCHVPRPVVG